MNVSNRGCIRLLSLRALLASRTRNLVAVLAITLTAVLFTSLFTIVLSINEGIQQNNFRQAGGWSHGTFKYLTEDQFEKLKDDPLIESWGLQRFVGMPTEVPFNKSHVEISYSDTNQAHWSYCDPVEDRLPQEGTDEAATDTHMLELLGVEPEIGVKFTVTFDVDGHTTTQVFTLCGWWEYDEAIVANHILIPESRVDAILVEVGVTRPSIDGMTGSWNLDVMLKHGARSIAANLEEILAIHGYQSETPGENYISTSVNWGYIGAQLSDKLDPTVVAILVGVLLLILLTGYLIIYNVFQISVAGDIRFYGLLADRVQLYGMEPCALSHLTALEGDLTKLNDPNGNYIAAVYSDDDYGSPEMDSHWARLGDRVTIRYVEEYEYYNPTIGEIYGSLEDVPEGATFAQRAVKYRDVDYAVAALAIVPSALSYRYYGADEFVMGAETFLRDTGTNCVMYYAFDTTEEANTAMEAFLQDYTENVNPQFDYESKTTYAGEFESTRSMFLLLGGVLSFIMGLVGVLNSFNSILTGITARRRELAVLQSIGMTSRQLRTMLALEGLLYTVGATLLALVLIVVTAPFVGPGLNGFIWFFTYHFTVWPIAVVLPLFGALGTLIPVLRCHAFQRYSVVERLHQE